MPRFMGFSLTSSAPEKSDSTAKNRVWGFFGDAPQSHRENRPQPKQPRQGDPPSLTKTASGRTYWPSRDPIGERGGVNLYGMVGNSAVGNTDYLGKNQNQPAGNCSECHGRARAAEAYKKTMDTANKQIPDAWKNWPKAAQGAANGLGGSSAHFWREYCGIVCCNKETGEVKSTCPHAGNLGGPKLTKKGWRRVFYLEPPGGDTKKPRRVDEDRRPANGSCNVNFDVVNRKRVTCKSEFGEGWKMVATYHSHPPGGNSFSEADNRNARNRSEALGYPVPTYVGTTRDEAGKEPITMEHLPDMEKPVGPPGGGPERYPGTNTTVEVE